MKTLLGINPIRLQTYFNDDISKHPLEVIMYLSAAYSKVLAYSDIDSGNHEGMPTNASDQLLDLVKTHAMILMPSISIDNIETVMDQCRINIDHIYCGMYHSILHTLKSV